MALNLKLLSESWWYEVTKLVKNAAVFIDNPSAECLHWHGGFLRLLKADVASVKEFSSFENGAVGERKAVFITSSPVIGSIRMILRDIISNSQFEHCILVTACSPIALTLATTGNVIEGTNEMTATGKLKMDMLHWMKNKEYTVEIFNFPFSFISITDHFFTMPPFQDLFPFINADLEGKTPRKALSKIADMESLPLELQVCILHFVTTINSLLTQLNAKEDIFCMGNLSSLIGNQLQNYCNSSVRSKNATSKVTLLLIDRTLDLNPVVEHNSICALDKMRNILPLFPGHTVDVAVQMNCLCSSKVKADCPTVPPGCLYQPKSFVFERLLENKPKDLISILHNEISSKAPKTKMPLKMTTETLYKLVLDLVQNKENVFNNLGLIQQSMAVVEAMSSPKVQILEMAESFQKLLLQSIASSQNTKEAIAQIQLLIQTRHEKGLDIEVLLTTIVYFYALVGDQFNIKPELEMALKETFTQAMIEDKDSLPQTSLNPLAFDETEVETQVVEELCSHIFRKLRSIQEARSNLIKYKNVTRYVGPVEPLEYKSVINQLLEDMVDPRKPDIPDLVYTQSDSLRSRFSLLLSSVKPHPMDNEDIIVFIIGGITGSEVCSIKDCLEANNKHVLIGSTTLASPATVLKDLFIKDPLKPYLL